MKFKTSSILLLGILISWPLELLYAEQLTITTYYPSPYGSYSELQLYPHAIDPPGQGPEQCTLALDGTVYYNSIFNDIYICAGVDEYSGTWLPSGQASEWWGPTTDATKDIFNLNDQDVRVKNRLMVGIGDVDLSSSRPPNLLTVSTNGSPGVNIGYSAGAVAPLDGMIVFGTVGLGKVDPAQNVQLDITTGKPVAIRTSCTPSVPGGGCLGVQSGVAYPSSIAIFGEANDPDATAIYGLGHSNNPAVAGRNDALGYGVYGEAKDDDAAGVYGASACPYAFEGYGVYGAANGVGVYGIGYAGVYGYGSYGVYADGLIYDILTNDFAYGKNGDWVTSTGISLKGLSDRNTKENFSPVDPKAILAKISQLPISQWSFKEDAEKSRHIGPVSQDFYALFGVSDEKHIAFTDASGVALAGIKALNQKIEEQAEEIRVLKSYIQKLEQRFTQ